VELWLASIKNYSLLQETYWRTHTAAEICNHIDAILQKGKRAARVKGFRFNESGEVMSLDDILKANTIAKHLRSRWGIKKIWTYTARIDLREHCDNLAFVLKGSGFLTKDGATMIIVGKSTPIPQGFRECPGNCGRCSLCAVRGTKIVFRAHGGKTNISKDITREEGIAAMFKFYPELSHLFGDIETMLKAA
jgi:hypothetical protein